MDVSRRVAFVGMTGMVGLVGLAGCTRVTSGGITTVTLDVARITRDGRAIVDALDRAVSNPGLGLLLGGNLIAAQAAIAGARAVLAEIDSLTQGTVSASIDTSSVQAAVSTLLVDAQSVLALTQNAVSSGSASAAGALNYLSAAATLITFLQVAADLVPVALRSSHRPATPMSEQQALEAAKK